MRGKLLQRGLLQCNLRSRLFRTFPLAHRLGLHHPLSPPDTGLGLRLGFDAPPKDSFSLTPIYLPLPAESLLVYLTLYFPPDRDSMICGDLSGASRGFLTHAKMPSSEFRVRANSSLLLHAWLAALMLFSVSPFHISPNDLRLLDIHIFQVISRKRDELTSIIFIGRECLPKVTKRIRSYPPENSQLEVNTEKKNHLRESCLLSFFSIHTCTATKKNGCIGLSVFFCMWLRVSIWAV